jgi:katanin p60 ATPase-containing subunit A1
MLHCWTPQALLRRLEKRILVPLPESKSREQMFHTHLDRYAEPGTNFSSLAASTEGYSGSDILLVAKEAAMRSLRRLVAQVEAGMEAPPAETAVRVGAGAGAGA